MLYTQSVIVAISALKDRETGSSADSIRAYIQEHASRDSQFNERAFLTALKNLIAQKTIAQVNGSNYKLTDSYLKKQTDLLAAGMEEAIKDKPHVVHPREEPGKESPARKTFHSKVKLNETSKIITIINPAHGPCREVEKMETDDETHDETMKTKKKTKIIPRKVDVKHM